MIIGISGYIGSGKDTVADMIRYIEIDSRYKNVSPENWTLQDLIIGRLALDNSLYKVKKFAGKLKQIVSLLTGISVEELEKQSVKDSMLGEEWNLMTVRALLQKLGTDACRDKVHPNIWVNALFAGYTPEVISNRPYHRQELLTSEGDDIEFSEKYPDWIISDTRFPNEAKAIKDKAGIVIRVNRPDGFGDFATVRHSSETSLDTWNFDYVINNSGSLEQLLEEVKNMMIHFKLLV